MAYSEGNVFVDGFRGKVGGNMVFRKRRSGKLIVAKNRKTSTLPPTEAQQVIRDKFKEAIIYGKAAMADPQRKQLYAAATTGDQSAYNVAVRDAAKPPEVKSLDATRYSGQPGGIIIAKAIDDFKVTAVKVSLHAADGTLIEEGDAVIGSNGSDWTYTTTVLNSTLAGTTVKAVASDMAGNQGPLVKTL